VSLHHEITVDGASYTLEHTPTCDDPCPLTVIVERTCRDGSDVNGRPNLPPRDQGTWILTQWSRDGLGLWHLYGRWNDE
jgi:hypothetical protein